MHTPLLVFLPGRENQVFTVIIYLAIFFCPRDAGCFSFVLIHGNTHASWHQSILRRLRPYRCWLKVSGPCSPLWGFGTDLLANVRLLYRDIPTYIITAKSEDGQIYACVVHVCEIDGGRQHKVLLQGEPGQSHWGFKSSLESIFRKTQELLGNKLNLVVPSQSNISH